MKNKFLATGLALIAWACCFSLLAFLFLPHAIEQRLTRNFSSYFGAESVSAEVDTDSFGNLLRGHTRSIKIDIAARANSPVAISRLEASWNQSDSVLDLLLGPRLYVRDAEAIDLVIYWDQSALAALLMQIQSLISEIELTIDSESIAISGQTKDGPVSFSAMPRIDDYLYFELNDILLNGVALDEEELAPYRDALYLDLKLTPLKWKIWPRQVELSAGQLKLVGSSKLPSSDQ